MRIAIVQTEGSDLRQGKHLGSSQTVQPREYPSVIAASPGSKQSFSSVWAAPLELKLTCIRNSGFAVVGAVASSRWPPTRSALVAGRVMSLCHDVNMHSPTFC